MLRKYFKNIRRRVVWSTGILQEIDQICENKIAQRIDQFKHEMTGHENLQSLFVERGAQLLLRMKYREMFESTRAVLSFDEVEFRNQSQNGEDGILWYIFSLIGTVNKQCVEICAGDGIQNNTANLIINHGWTGLLFDGVEENVKRGEKFFNCHPDTFAYPPKFVHAWITAENIDDLIASNGFSGEIDLLSLDIDGVDYWIWKAIEVIRPRVVVMEIQTLWGWETSVTVPYRPDFKAEFINGFGVYCGASLPAFVKLGRQKGYRLVGCQRYAFNAFFIRDDVGREQFPEISAEKCFSHPFYGYARDKLLPLISAREWQEV